MHLLDLGYDLLSYLFSQFGSSPQAYVQRVVAKMTCRAFLDLPNLLFFRNNRILLNKLLSDVRRKEMREELPVYDLDDYEWHTVEFLGRMKEKTPFHIQSNPPLIQNPFTWKILNFDPIMKHWVQSYSKDHLLQDRSTQPKIKIPSHVSDRRFILDGKRGEHINCDISQQQTHSFWTGLLRSVCTDLTSRIHCNLLTLSVKESICTTTEFDMIAEVLPLSNIRRLNLSGHNDSEQRDLSKIFINAQNIEHLNIGYSLNLSSKEHASLLHLLHITNSLHTLKMFYTWFDVHSHLLFPARAANLCPSLHILNVSLLSDKKETYLDASVGGNLQLLGLTEPESNTEYFIKQDQHSNLWCDYEIVRDASIVKILLQLHLPNLYPQDPHPLSPKISKPSAYSRKNQKRNRLLFDDRMCASCGHVWTRGSIKIQTFEGLQSMCKLNKRKCNQSKHY
jgi:ribosomal protein L31